MKGAGKGFYRGLLACAVLLLIAVVAGQAIAVSGQYVIGSGLTSSRYYDIQGNLINLYANPWGITMSADQTTVKLGSPVKLTAVITYNGTPQKDVMVLFDAGGASSWSTTQFTDASGKVSATFTPSGTGSYRVNATARQQSGSGFNVLNAAYLIVNVQNRPIMVQVDAQPESVSVNDNAEVAVTVTDFNTKAPVSGALVHLNASGGTLKSADGATAVNGVFTTQFTPGAEGLYTIDVKVTATGYDAWLGAVQVQGANREMNVSVDVSPSPVSAGSEATVTVTASGQGGPVSGATVNITSTGGTVAPVSVKTGPDGKYTAKLKIDQAGDYTVTAAVNADGYTQAQKSVSVTVQQASDSTIMLCLGGLVLAIVLIIVLFLLSKWLKSDLKVVPKKTKVPADGTTKVPVRVQFTNGFGMAKKMSRDTEVDLESTAGTIKGVTIPSGKEYADSDLTTSKEFGPVTVTGKSGGRMTHASMEFVVEKGTLEVAIQPAEIPADGKSSANVTVRVKDDKGGVVAPLEEKSIDLTTTLGTVPSPVTMPARAQSVSTIITSGEVSGIAVVTAVTGDLRGEGKVTFKGTPKRFCMHCGTPMSLEAAQCPNCGKTPPSGVDTRQCPTCGTVIPEAAKFCYKCGARQPDKK